jgi:hypothetical protein
VGCAINNASLLPIRTNCRAPCGTALRLVPHRCNPENEDMDVRVRGSLQHHINLVTEEGSPDRTLS